MFGQFLDGYRYWKVKAKDFVIWFGTFLASIIFDLPLGLVYDANMRKSPLCRDGHRRGHLHHDHPLRQRQAVRHHARAGAANHHPRRAQPMHQVSSSELYRDINRVRNPKPIPGTTIFRYHASLNFANMDYFQVDQTHTVQRRPTADCVQAQLYQHTVWDLKNPSAPLHTAILDFRRANHPHPWTAQPVCSTVNEVDSTAVKQLMAMSKDLKDKHKVRMLLANVRGSATCAVVLQATPLQGTCVTYSSSSSSPRR